VLAAGLCQRGELFGLNDGALVNRVGFGIQRILPVSTHVESVVRALEYSENWSISKAVPVAANRHNALLTAVPEFEPVNAPVRYLARHAGYTVAYIPISRLSFLLIRNGGKEETHGTYYS
jgi:hypothetical protein